MYIAIAVTGVAFKYWTNIIISSTYIIIYYLTDVISTYLIYTNPEFQLRRTNCKAMVSPATSSISMQPRQASMRFSSPRELDAKVIGWLFPTNSQSMHRMMLMQNSWGKKFRPKWWNDKWLTAANGHADFFALSSAAWGSKRSSFMNAF